MARIVEKSLTILVIIMAMTMIEFNTGININVFGGYMICVVVNYEKICKKGV